MGLPAITSVSTDWNPSGEDSSCRERLYETPSSTVRRNEQTAIQDPGQGEGTERLMNTTRARRSSLCEPEIESKYVISYDEIEDDMEEEILVTFLCYCVILYNRLGKTHSRVTGSHCELFKAVYKARLTPGAPT